MHASLREGGLFLTALCAPRSQGGLPVGCTLPLEGAGLVVWFAGRPPVPRRPGELHPLGQLLLTPVFQHFSGLEIDLHRGGLSCAHRALLRFLKNFNSLHPKGFSEGCVLQRCTCGYLCSPLTASSCRGGGEENMRDGPWPRKR